MSAHPYRHIKLRLGVVQYPDLSKIIEIDEQPLKIVRAVARDIVQSLLHSASRPGQQNLARNRAITR